MTFEEWFTKEYWPIDAEDWNDKIEEEERMVTNMRRAWEAGRAEGVEAMGGPVDS